MFDQTKNLERFFKMVSKTATCWVWVGSKVRGYGTFYVCGVGHRRAHRWIFEQVRGDILPGNVICHRCDNPSCVNPDHLFQGTQADNLRDMVAKGRSTANRKMPSFERNKSYTRIICRRGHMKVGKNLNIRVIKGINILVCRECAEAFRIKYREKIKEAA